MNMPVAYDVAMASTFQEAMAALPPVSQAAVLDAITKLQKGHAAVHVHALQGGLPWVSFNVSRDALRVICAREDQTLMLHHVGAHDAAYLWASRHAPRRFGAIIRLVKVEVDDASAPVRTTTTGPDAERADATSGRAPTPLLTVKDKSFRLIDVPARAAAALRAIPDDDALLEVCGLLRDATAEAVLGLATDQDDLQGIVHRYRAALEGQTTTLAEAIKAPVNSERVWLLPHDVAAIEAALSADADTWRVFLHPSQRRLVTMTASGPVLVTGGPGTGKTVVALHRARHLLEQAATSTPSGAASKPLLLTTFSRVLARHLEEGLTSLCRDRPELLQGCVVSTLTAAARAVLSSASLPHALLLDEDLDAAWAEALKHETLGRGRAFYEAERREVVLPHGVVDEAGYLKAPRAGRGERLERKAKLGIWSVLQAFDAALTRRGGDDATGLAWRATRALRAGAAVSPYAGVVCDEVQDASLAELMLLEALAGGSLFLVGDGHQRLYRKPVSLRAAGVEVRGRSVRLRLNYRTTHGICTAALQHLDGIDIDVLEAEAHQQDELEGYRSVRAGPVPERHTFANDDAEADLIATVVKASMQASTKAPVLILARTRAALERLQSRLRDRGVSAPLLGDFEAAPTGVPAILATLHRCKGLEAPTVILSAAQLLPQPYRGGGDDDDRALHARQERLLVYVGMTRARDRCLITRV